MSIELYDPRGKPASWAFEQGLLRPQGTELWSRCTLAMPFWNYGAGQAANLAGGVADALPGSAGGGIAVLNHDGGDFSEYDDSSNIGSGGFKVTVDAAAGLNSTSHGVKIDLDGVSTGTRYAVKDIPQWTTDTMRIRFFVDPNSVAITANLDYVVLVSTYYNTSQRDVIRLGQESGGYVIQVRMKIDPGSTTVDTSYAISDAPTRVEVAFRRSSGSSTNDGEFETWLDGVSQGVTGSIDRFDIANEANKIRVGASGGDEQEFTGSVYVDGVIVRDDDTEIGLSDFTVGTLDWDADAEGPIVLTTASNDKLHIVDPPGNQLDGTTQLSAEVRFRADTVPSGGNQAGLIGKWQATTGERSWRLYLEGDELRLEVSSDGSNSGTYTTDAANIQASTWYRCIFTYNAGTVVFYLDGVVKSHSVVTSRTSIHPSASKFLVGARMDASGGVVDPLTGAFSSIRVWVGRVLNATEVSEFEEHPWEMYTPRFLLPSFGLEEPASGPAGPWELALTVPAGQQFGLVENLTNGVSYDIQAKTVDQSGNESTGSTVLSETPAVPAATAPQVRFLQVPDLIPSSIDLPVR